MVRDVRSASGGGTPPPWSGVTVRPDATATARGAAAHIAGLARESIGRRGRFVAALSGGSTPEPMLRALARETLDWHAVHIVQVDERIAPAGSRERNLTLLRSCILGESPLAPHHLHAMPVDETDLAAAAERYARTLSLLAGEPPVLDLVQLGLGTDGHTASLAPGDAVLGVTDADVALTDVYRGWRRMTLTFPAINRARNIVWLVTGADKAPVLASLGAGDAALPASRVRGARAVLYADGPAAGALGAAGS